MFLYFKFVFDGKKSETEKNNTKMAIDLNTSKKIIYQYNIHQLNLASVEFDDNYSNKCINIPKQLIIISLLMKLIKLLKIVI